MTRSPEKVTPLWVGAFLVLLFGWGLQGFAAERPDPWAHAAIGNAENAGSANFEGEVFSGTGTGRGCLGASDELHFIYAPMVGEGTITVRVVPPLGSSSQVGVMMRK